MGSYPDRPVYGMLLAFAAFASFAAMQVFGKLLGEHGYHVIEVAFFRNGLGCAGIVLWILAARRPEFLKTRRPAANMIRGLIGAVGLWFTYGAFRLMPMSETTVFLFTSSLILPVLAIVFLKDHVGIYRWGAILAGFAGVALMAQPSGQVTLYGAVIALVAAGIHAAAGIFMRQLGKTDHTFTIVFYFTLVGTLAPAAILPFVWQSPTPGDMWLFAGGALSGTAAQLLLSQAYRFTVPANIAPLNYSGLIWAVIFDFCIWSYVPGWPVFAGAAVVIASNLFIVYRERRLGRRLLKHQPMT